MNALDKALSLLSVREHTEKEIREKLRKKGFSYDEIDEAVSKLIADGLLSEKRFAESYIRSRFRKMPEGRGLLRMRLREKGSPPEAADEAIESFWEEESYRKPLCTYYQVLVRKIGEEKAWLTLRTKGFTDSEIRNALQLVDD